MEVVGNHLAERVGEAASIVSFVSMPGERASISLGAQQQEEGLRRQLAVARRRLLEAEHEAEKDRNRAEAAHAQVEESE